MSIVEEPIKCINVLTTLGFELTDNKQRMQYNFEQNTKVSELKIIEIYQCNMSDKLFDISCKQLLLKYDISRVLKLKQIGMILPPNGAYVY